MSEEIEESPPSLRETFEAELDSADNSPAVEEQVAENPIP